MFRMTRPGIVATTFCAIGLLLALHPMLLTELSRMQGAPVDTRLNNYVLELEYRWASSGGRRSLWNAGFFHPVSNVAAFGDVQLGAMPYYAIWRIAGRPYDTAFQLWWMTILTLDFAAFWFLLRRTIQASPLAAGFGSFLFAFGAPRVNQAGHEQLLAQFYIVAALYALYRLAHRAPRAPVSAAWLFVLSAAVVAQLYTGFYFGWFFLLALVLTGLWVAMVPSFRSMAAPVFRHRWRALLAAGALGVIATLPLWLHYREAALIVGMREWPVVERLLPQPQSWIYLGPFSWLYRWQYGLAPFRVLVLDQEHRLGIGLVTMLVAGIGLYRGRREPGTKLLVLVCATLVLCVTTVPIGEWLWRLVFEAVPGAAAIRAVARIGILMLIPVGLGAAYFVDRVRPRAALLALALGASVLEQAQTTPSYDKLAVRRDVQALASQIGAHCDAFLFTPLAGAEWERSGFEDGKHQLDAMWAGLLTGIPTLNGLSGNVPPGWDFAQVTIRTDAGEERIGRALGDWCRRWDLDATRVCRIRSQVDWSWTVPRSLRRELLRSWRDR
jgi:hypothetical protein